MFSENIKLAPYCEDSLPERVKWIYGVGELGQQFAQMMLAMFMLFFFTNVLGISAGDAGTLFLVARLWDAVNAPIMGAVIDRTNHKMGKCRPFIMWFAIPAGCFLFMCFYAPDVTPTMKLVWAYVAYIGLSMAYTATGLSYTMLISRAACSAQDRVSMNSKRVIMSAVSGVIVSGATMHLVNFFGNGNMKIGFAVTVAIYALIMIVSYFVVVYIMKPYDLPDSDEVIAAAAADKINVFDELKLLVKNPVFCLAIGATTVFITCSTISTTAMLYYTTYVLQSDTAFTILAPLSTATSLLAGITLPLFVKLSRKSTISFWGLLIGGIATLIRFITCDTNFTIMIILACVIGITVSYASGLLVPITLDAVVYNEYTYGRRMDGLTISALTFVTKLALGLGAAMVGYYLEFAGFDETVATQTSGALDAIINSTLLIPALLYLTAGVILFLYGRYEKKLPEMAAAIAERSAETSASIIEK